jgi:hypothetical protein
MVPPPYPPFGYHPSEPSVILTPSDPTRTNVSNIPPSSKNTPRACSAGRKKEEGDKTQAPWGCSMTPASKSSGSKTNHQYPIFGDTSTITTATLTIVSSTSTGTPSSFLIGTHPPLTATKEVNRQLNPRGLSRSCSNGHTCLSRDRTPAPQLKDTPENQPLAPKLALPLPTNTPPPSLVQATLSSPYIKASNARRAIRKSLACTNKAHKLAANIREVQREKARLVEIKTQLLLLIQASQEPQASGIDQNMGNLAEETATCKPSKKKLSGNDATLMTTTAASTTSYALPMRANSKSKKCSQVASSAKHYATALDSLLSPSNSRAKFFKPGKGSDQALANTLSLSTCLSAWKYPEEAIDVDNSQEVIDVDNKDDTIDGIANNFLPGNDDNNGELKLGHEAKEDSPLTHPPATKSIGISNNPHKMTLFATNGSTTGTCSANTTGTPPSPPKCPSALRVSSFTPVANTSIPTIDNAVNKDPDFFEGTDQDGSGEGPHFISVSFIKDKIKIRDQLLKALSDTINVICGNLPNAMIHCIKKDTKLPPISSTTGNNFPSSGMQARQYMYIQKDSSLMPGIRNKPKLPPPRSARTVDKSLTRTADTTDPTGSLPSCGFLLSAT